MKLRIIISAFFITVLANILLGQVSDIYTLKSNLNKFYTDDFKIMSFCSNYIENDIKLKSEDLISINLDEENYILNEFSKKYYNDLNSLSYKEKAKLLYAISIINKSNYESINNIGFNPKLLYLPVVISGLNPNYYEKGFAFGIWGLKYIPAIRYGIYADSYYDERLDIKKSSEVAISYLKDLHLNFKTWDYSITSFSTSASETEIFYSKNYAFDSIAQIIDPNNVFYKFIGLCKWIEDNIPIQKAMIRDEATIAHDTIEINKLLHFKQIAEVLSIDYDTIKTLNPLYVQDIINGKSQMRKIVLPLGFADKYYSLSDSIHRYKDSTFFADLYLFNKNVNNKNKIEKKNKNSVPNNKSEYKEIKHKISSGENLGSIAQKYEVKISEIKEWNELRNEKIYAGKELKIWVNNKSINNPTKTKKEDKKPVFNDKGYKLIEIYIVKAKDSPFSISKNYPWTSPEEIMKWNNIDNPSKLQVGQELKILKKNE